MPMTGWAALDDEIDHCRSCPRLVQWREEVARTRRRAYRDQAYWGRPVPGFGDHEARILAVGLAPGAHGANRTGRVFTGDSSGDFLCSALHRAGFANQPLSTAREDGLQLTNLYLSAVCRCAPPQNRPTRPEIAACARYLVREIELLASLRLVVALGKFAFDSVLAILAPRSSVQAAGTRFSHLSLTRLGPDLPQIISSYHPSRQNTQTGRLSAEMFDQVWLSAKMLLNDRSDAIAST